MIYQEAAPLEIRVERVERRMWVETGIGVALALFLAIYFASLAIGQSLVHYLPTAALIVLIIVLLIFGIRRRPVLVVKQDRFGYGFLKRKMWWFDREQLSSVIIRKNLVLQVLFFDQDGKLFASSVFAYFDPKELRKAFEMAGISVQ